MGIALNMITRDGEPHLELALMSAEAACDELVVVYTGREDAPELEACRRRADRVLTVPWSDDFSAARNAALDATRSEWVLWLDSDEVLPAGSAEKIRAIPGQTSPSKFQRFKLVHGGSSMGQVRMWHRSSGARWQGRVHERVQPTEAPDERPDIVVEHRPQNVARSSARNINILAEELAARPNDPDLLFYSAIEHHLAGLHMKALAFAERFLFCAPDPRPDIRKSYMRYLKAWILVHRLGDCQAAAEIVLGQLVVNCNSAELWCLLGDIYSRIGRLPHARRFYANAIVMGRHRFDNMWVVDRDKYGPYPEARIAMCEAAGLTDATELAPSGPIIP